MDKQKNHLFQHSLNTKLYQNKLKKYEDQKAMSFDIQHLRNKIQSEQSAVASDPVKDVLKDFVLRRQQMNNITVPVNSFDSSYGGAADYGQNNCSNIFHAPPIQQSHSMDDELDSQQLRRASSEPNLKMRPNRKKRANERRSSPLVSHRAIDRTPLTSAVRRRVFLHSHSHYRDNSSAESTGSNSPPVLTRQVSTDDSHLSSSSQNSMDLGNSTSCGCNNDCSSPTLLRANLGASSISVGRPPSACDSFLGNAIDTATEEQRRVLAEYSLLLGLGGAPGLLGSSSYSFDPHGAAVTAALLATQSQLAQRSLGNCIAALEQAQLQCNQLPSEIQPFPHYFSENPNSGSFDNASTDPMRLIRPLGRTHSAPLPSPNNNNVQPYNSPMPPFSL